MQFDETLIKIWMSQKYKFWKDSFPYFKSKGQSFWDEHPIGELPKRVQYLQILSKYVDNPKTVSVIDVGMGGGMWPWLLANLGFNVKGVDWGEKSTQAEFVRLHPGIECYSLLLDREKWPIADNSVDICTALDVIEHIHPPLSFIMSEINRVLKPGGILIMTTPNQANLRKRICLLLGKSIYNPLKEYYEDNPFKNHIREFTRAEVVQIGELAGFKCMADYCLNHLYHTRYAEAKTFGKRLLLKLYKMATLLNNDFQDTVVIVAEKSK